MRLALSFPLFCMAMVLATPPTRAAEFFLSDVAFVTNCPLDIDTSSASSGVFGIYVVPGEGDESILNGVSLNLTSDSADFDFDITSLVFNPLVTGGKRWFDDNVDGFGIETVEDQALINIFGSVVDSGQGSGEPGQGLGAPGDAPDAGTGGYLFAAIDVSWVAGASGTLDLSLGAGGVIDSANQMVVDSSFRGGWFGYSSQPWPIPGDANIDGVVSGLDIPEVVNNFGAVCECPGDYLLGDANADCVVSGLDITSVINNFGAIAPPPFATTVPEPGSSMFLWVTTLCAVSFRKRRTVK